MKQFFLKFDITMSKLAGLVIILSATFTFNDEIQKVVAFGIAAGMFAAKQVVDGFKTKSA